MNPKIYLILINLIFGPILLYTYYKGLKLVIIDNAEKLSINSSNALLKAIEEPSNDTYFFVMSESTIKKN